MEGWSVIGKWTGVQLSHVLNMAKPAKTARYVVFRCYDAMDDGIDVRGYLHWSLLDNYEWGSFTPTFGLASWDRDTFERHPKPSLDWLGSIARTGVMAR